MAYNDGHKGRKDSVKAWAEFKMSTTTIYSSYNVSSITDQGTGHCRINYDTALSSASYASFASASPTSGGSKNYVTGTVSSSASYSDLYRENSDGNGHDTSGAVHFLVIGE